MNYLSAENLSRHYGEKVLFEGLSMGLAQGQKVALIGVNGCGKSSLLKILAGVEEPDKGRVSYRKGIRVAYLPQEPVLPAGKTVGEVVFSADLPAMKAIQAYESLLIKGNLGPEDQKKMDEVMAEIARFDAWDYEHRIQQILTQLQVNFLDKEVSTLSGGQAKRVALAQTLIEEPELLIMDEPTNHLDLPAIEWLERFLSTSKQTLILVTHDRYFLDSITQEIFEMENGRIYSYKGDYAFFLMKKAEREVQQDTEREKAMRLYKGELEWLRRSPKARTTKSKSRIDAAGVLKNKAHNYRDTSQVRLQIQGRRIGGKVMEIKKVRKAYGDLKILEDFTYTFNRRDRIGIVGPNGIGKTTFIRMILGEEEPDSGKIRVGDTIHFGYYRQDGLTFKPNQRIIDVVTEVAEEVAYSVKGERIPAAQLLEYFLFPYSSHYNRVETLSGGKKRRLHLLRVLMSNPNFLVLDEPTNDLDLVTLRRLEEFLENEYHGCLVVVSHDRYFMDRMIDHLFVFQGEGKIKDYPGSYSQYQTWRMAEERKQEAEAQPLPSKSEPTEPIASPAKKKTKLSYKEQREFDELESALEELETEKAQLQEWLASGESDYEKLTTWTDRLKEVNSSLEEKSDRWLELATSIE